VTLPGSPFLQLGTVRSGTEAPSPDDETVFLGQRNGLETETCLDFPIENGGHRHAIHCGVASGLLARGILGRVAAGRGAFMTLIVALLVCVSDTVFLAHAFDAYHAG
jgi:hypothetical protein